jgi:1,4-dihydroxy-2-naphthoate octaprenyltransferase
MTTHRLRTWRTISDTANLPEGMTHPPDAVSKWLVITRAAVFSMTATSGLIGGLLAMGAARLQGTAEVDWLLLALAIFGLVVAHAANNMINDFFDLSGGVDTEGYVRAHLLRGHR